MVAIGDTPDLFHRTMNAVASGETPPINTTEIEENFLDLCKEEFNLSDDFNDYGRLFELILSYLEIMPRSRSPRFQALFSSFWALETVSILLTFFSIISLLLSHFSVGISRGTNISLIVFLLGVVSAYVFRQRKETFEKNWVEYAMLDFYNYSKTIEDPHKQE